MTDITFKDIENEVRRLVNENPDYKYPAPYDGLCTYNAVESEGEDGTEAKPACLFGQAFTNLGSPIPDKHEGQFIQTVLGVLGINSTRAERCWAGAVQDKQDNSRRWREAVAFADRIYPIS
ncbi:hypothetical protein [Actinomadura sp. WMMB 499]|uniref:hypothetical protein n=1 Tax=Actinomadura sp. WMMB 499 TaxID=1219491 RepID=UPI00124729DE|nr:hypothetical protein [Actinomadura sp. WMMB 499]QFG25428.1 hypothetical protein F7P10_33990 [Actinomadura sp. WMMB 499]